MHTCARSHLCRAVDTVPQRAGAVLCLIQSTVRTCALVQRTLRSNRLVRARGVYMRFYLVHAVELLIHF